MNAQLVAIERTEQQWLHAEAFRSHKELLLQCGNAVAAEEATNVRHADRP
jgi:hypothetical protein